jgi:hypothetical protein
MSSARRSRRTSRRLDVTSSTHSNKRSDPLRRQDEDLDVQPAKPHLDVGLFCRNTQASHASYEKSIGIGLPYEKPVSTVVRQRLAHPVTRATSPGLVPSAHQTLVPGRDTDRYRIVHGELLGRRL